MDEILGNVGEIAYGQALGNSNTRKTWEDKERKLSSLWAWQKEGTQGMFITHLEIKLYFSFC